MQGFGDTAGNRIQLDADVACTSRSMAHEVARAAPWFQDRGASGNTEAGDCLVDTGNHRRRSVKSVKRRALSGAVFLGREQCFQFLAEGLPARILVTAGLGMGEDVQRNGAE